MKHAINWFEIPASDLYRAKKFYEHIFGFEMYEMNLGDGLQMALFPAEDGAVSGTLIKNKEWYHPSESEGPLLYLNANPDMQNILNRVEEAGGQVTIPKRLITEDHGYMSVILDCEGNRIALHSDS